MHSLIKNGYCVECNTHELVVLTIHSLVWVREGEGWEKIGVRGGREGGNRCKGLGWEFE